jgi:hypothetical protein
MSSRRLFRNVRMKMYKSVILPVVLYGYETWSLVLREKTNIEGVSEQGA